MTGKELKKARIEAELTVTELAKLAEIARGTIYYYEEGYRNIGNVTSQKLKRIIQSRKNEIDSLS